MQETLETQVRSLGWEEALEEKIATHSCILTWKILWTDEPNGLQSMGLQKSQTWLSTLRQRWGWAVGKSEWGMPTHGYRVYFRGYKNVFKLDFSGNSSPILWTEKKENPKHWIVYFKWVNCTYANYISGKFFFFEKEWSSLGGKLGRNKGESCYFS